MTDPRQPHGRLLSAADAQRVLGIPAATVRSWHHRRRHTGLYPIGLDRRHQPLFYEADLLQLRRGRRLRDRTGRRHETMPDQPEVDQ